MGFDVIIKGGTVALASGTLKADVAIQGERIVALGQDLPTGGARVIEATGRVVLPGALDVHVHLQLPFCGTVSADDFESGTRAAARGGITTIIDYALQDGAHGLLAGIEKRRAEADPKVCVDYGLHSIITKWNDDTRREMGKVIEAGIPTFKMFMIYESEGWLSDDGALFGALAETAENGGRILVHAESEKVMKHLIARHLPRAAEVGAYGHVLSRPNFVEYEAIRRACTWADVTGGRLYIVHMSTGEGADIVKEARDRGVDVVAETCPQYLVLQDDVFKDRERGHLFATCPQIKKKADNDRLWAGLARGEVSVVATDTCTFTTRQKAMWNGDFTRIPFGLPGSETMLPLLWTHGYKAGKFGLERLVEIVATNPARVHGLYPRKGTLAVGSDADVAIIDPDRTRVVRHEELDTNCDWSPYEGAELGGFPDVVLSRGTVVVEGGRFVGRPGHGRFLERRIGARV